MNEQSHPALSDDFDLNLLPALQALLQTKSVTQSAMRLGLSQPSASRLLSRLRDTFHDPLLVKSNHGMTLTPRARALQEPVERWAQATHHLLRDAGDENPASFTGTFTIASTDYGLLSVLMPALQGIIEAAPRLRLEVVPLTVDYHNDLTAGAVDIVMTGYEPEPGRAFERLLYTETYHCVLRPDHPLLRDRANNDDPLSLEDFTTWPHLAAKIDGREADPVCGQLAQLGLTRHIALRVPYFSASPHLLLACDAIMVAPRRAAERFVQVCGLRAIPAPLELEPFNYWVLWHERSRRDPATNWLVDQLAQAISAEGPAHSS